MLSDEFQRLSLRYNGLAAIIDAGGLSFRAIGEGVQKLGKNTGGIVSIQ